MSTRNLGSSDQALKSLLRDLRDRVGRLERRRPSGTGGAEAVDGVDGVDGEDGVGVPAGGTTNQVLAKLSNTDFDTAWITDVNDLPTLGAAGEFLGKVSATNYDVDWLKPIPVFADTAARDAFFTSPGFGDQCSVEDGTRQFFDGVGWLAWDLDWVTYTASYNGFTIGSGTSTPRYMRRGRMCDVDWEFILGAGSAVALAGQVDLPFNGVFPGGSFPTNRTPRGFASFVDSSASTGYTGYTRVESASRFRVLTINSAGTYTVDAAVDATIPFTWASGDSIFAGITFTMSSPYV